MQRISETTPGATRQRLGRTAAQRRSAPFAVAMWIASSGVNPASTSSSTSRWSPKPAITPPVPVGSRVPHQSHVIPAKAGIQFVSSKFRGAYRVGSRFRGNDV